MMTVLLFIAVFIIGGLVGFIAAAVMSAAGGADLIEENERLQRELQRERRKGK